MHSVKMDFTTHEPTFLQQLAQAYCFNPNSWLLRRFKVEGDKIHIETLNGKTFDAAIADCVFRYQIDDFDRHEITVRSGDRKIHFKEIPYMLADDEWAAVVDFCLNTCHAEMTTLGKITSVLQVAKKMTRGR